MKYLIPVMRKVIIVALMAWCGGCVNGCSENSTPMANVQISGVAAAGLPLIGTVTLKDSSGTAKQLSTTIADDGTFSFDVSSLTPPFLLQGTGTANGTNYTLYSLSSTIGTCNINPLTHLAVTMANSGQDPTTLFSGPTPTKMQALSIALPTALASMKTRLAPLFSQVGASPGNIITDQYSANRHGLDMLFDMASINVGNGSVSITNKADGGTILPSAPITNGLLDDATPDIGKMYLPVISGSVATSSGSGILGVVVTAYPGFGCGGIPGTPINISSSAISSSKLALNKMSSLPSLWPTYSTTTDSDGKYTLNMPNGTYWLVASLSGYGFGPNAIDVTANKANITGQNFTGASGGIGMFAGISHLAIDSKGNVYVADSDNNRIQKFSSNGVYITQWGISGTIAAIAIDSKNNVFVALSDFYHQLIQKYNSSGDFITQWGGRGSGNGQFYSPNGLAVDSNDSVYVVESNRIQKFSNIGTYIAQWGTAGSGNGQFDSASTITFDSNGNIYVVDTGNYRIQKFSSSGDYIAQWETPGKGSNIIYVQSAIAVDSNGNVNVVVNENNYIMKFTNSGDLIGLWGTPGSGNGQFKHISALAFANSGNMYVADYGNYRIQKFSSSGEYLGQWGMFGTLSPGPPTCLPVLLAP